MHRTTSPFLKIHLLLVVIFLAACTAASSSAAAQTAIAPLSTDLPELRFHAVEIGGEATLRFRITNNSSKQVVVPKVSSSNAVFQVVGVTLPLKLAAHQTAPIFVRFLPRSSAWVNSTLTISNNSSVKNFVFPVHGTGVSYGPAAVSTTAVNFGGVQMGGSKAAYLTLTNTGSWNLTFYSAQILGGSDFYTSGLSLPLVLAPSQSVTFGVGYKPAKTGTATVDLSLINDHRSRTVTLSGTGTAAGALIASPSTLSFGSLTVGRTNVVTGSLTASGASVTVNSASVTSSEFLVSGLSFPFTITAGQSKAYSVTFKPGASGSATGNLQFAAAGGAVASQALAGTGIAAAAHSVTLTWSAPPAGVTGFNLYRSRVSGGPYNKLNSVVDSATSFLDSSVLAGQSYYYVATSVDTAGVESSHSGEIRVTIPTP